MADDNGEEHDEPVESKGTSFNWWLVAIPVLALLTFVLVLLFGAGVFEPSSIHESVELVHVALASLAIFVILLVLEFVVMTGSHPENLEDDEEPAPGPDTPAAREDVPGGTAQADEPGDLEALLTDDRLEGRDVLEMARPPKQSVDAGVYATTYVEVDDSRVLRLEEIVARRS
jgi:hypothetical protein